MLNYLADYTEFHFREEEGLQESISYPGIKEHKQKHEELRNTVQELHDMLMEEEGSFRRVCKRGTGKGTGLALLSYPDL